jgi:hypothetical protein
MVTVTPASEELAYADVEPPRIGTWSQAMVSPLRLLRLCVFFAKLLQ